MRNSNIVWKVLRKKVKGSEMKSRKILFLGVVAGCMVFADLELANVPAIQSISVQCEVLGSQTFTVDVTFVSFANAVKFVFRNVATGQLVNWSDAGTMLTEKIPVPAGTYNLTVTTITGQGLQALWNNIVVPPIVSTNGQGTGCRFSSLGETPALGE